MSNTTYLCIAVIFSFAVLSVVMKDDSPFETEDVSELPEFNQKLDSPMSVTAFNSYSDPEIEEMENLLEKDFAELKEGITRQAWSVLVGSYLTKEDVMKDFVLLKKKGYKAYIRDSIIDDKVVYTLNVGPNINEETVRSAKKEIKNLLNVSPVVQYYQD